jgi:hypothetical protein
MEVEFLKDHGHNKKGKVTLVTNDFAKELIKKKIAKATGENKFLEKEAKAIEKHLDAE